MRFHTRVLLEGKTATGLQVPDAQPSVQTFFDQLSFTHGKEWVRWIEDAKKLETRQARLTKTIDELREGRRTH